MKSFGVPGGTGSEEIFVQRVLLCEGGKLPHTLPANEARQGTAPPQVVWGKNASACPLRQQRPSENCFPRRGRQAGWYLSPSSVGVNRRFSEHQRRKPPPHRGQSLLWKNAAIQAVPVTRAPAPHFPQVVDRGRAGILQWRKQRRTKGEWSHEAGTDRTRTLRLQQ